MKNNLKLNIHPVVSALGVKHSSLSMDVSGLIDDFGYKPDTSLEDGIGKFVKWYKKFYGDKND